MVNCIPDEIIPARLFDERPDEEPEVVAPGPGNMPPELATPPELKRGQILWIRGLTRLQTQVSRPFYSSRVCQPTGGPLSVFIELDAGCVRTGLSSFRNISFPARERASMTLWCARAGLDIFSSADTPFFSHPLFVCLRWSRIINMNT